MEISDGYTSGEIARICGITKKTLRYYEKIGLLKPYYVDPDNKYRIYAHYQVYFIEVIKSFKKSNIQLKDIKGVSFDNIKSVFGLFNKQIKEIDKEIEKLREAKDNSYRWIEFFKWFENSPIDEYKDGDIKVKTLKSKQVAFIKEKAPDYNDKFFYKLYDKLTRKIEDNNLYRVGPYILAIDHRKKYFDDNKMKFEMFAAVGNAENKKLDFVKIMPEQIVASIIHKGSQKGFVGKIQDLKKWINENNYKIIGPVYYSAVLPFGIVKDEKHVITEIYRPVKKIK